MSVTTIQADVSQSVFEFLHSELVEYFLERHSSEKVNFIIYPNRFFPSNANLVFVCLCVVHIHH